MKYKKILILKVILLTFIFTSTIFAGPRSKRGLSAAPELLIPVGSVGTSLGGANLSLTSGVDALYWNPSGLANMKSKTAEVLFSHQRYIADINLNYFAGGYNLGNFGVVGVSIKSMSFGDIPITTTEAPDGTGGTYSPIYLVGGLSFARSMTDRIKVGVTAKVIHEQIMRVMATGIAFDLGLQYLVGQSGLKFGVALKNIGPSLRFDGPDLEAFYQPPGTVEGTPNEPRRVFLSDFELPSTLELGLSYDMKVGKNNSVSVCGAFQNASFSADEYRVGLEYNFKKIFYLRGAYAIKQDFFETKQARDDLIFGPTFGAGIHYNAGAFDLNIDYAFRVTKRFDANQFFTLNLGF